jgi:hypothetical protein
MRSRATAPLSASPTTEISQNRSSSSRSTCLAIGSSSTIKVLNTNRPQHFDRLTDQVRLAKIILVDGPTRAISGVSGVVCGARLARRSSQGGRAAGDPLTAFRSVKLRARPPFFRPVRKIVLHSDPSVPVNWHPAKFVDASADVNDSHHDTMRPKHSERSVRGQFPIAGLAIVAILVLGLLGGLFHHHESASDSAACSYCHAGVQTPLVGLANALVTPCFAAVGSVAPAQPSGFPRIVHFSTLVPRAPPVPNHPVMFWEGCVGLV